ncbi:hypothetical protein CK203_011187 [Vitis vinifera]|uniref:Uncharacterized protein n=1 Tax=Vitis vinifera TaxID=29760 RepID=A0A438JZ72_VITVI|nr:hypothetical protein CK203_011187 [Vitis vinifera]
MILLDSDALNFQAGMAKQVSGALKLFQGKAGKFLLSCKYVGVSGKGYEDGAFRTSMKIGEMGEASQRNASISKRKGLDDFDRRQVIKHLLVLQSLFEGVWFGGWGRKEGDMGAVGSCSRITGVVLLLGVVVMAKLDFPHPAGSVSFCRGLERAFLKSDASYLPKPVSDHNPVLLACKGARGKLCGPRVPPATS